MAKLRALLVFSAIAVAACASDGPAYGPPSEDAAAVVAMTTTLGFSPEKTVVKVGQTIEWRNRSLFTHTVTFDPHLADEPSDIALPAGAAPFSSGPVPPGQIFRHRFTVPGIYHYVCQPHEDMGMSGTIVVQQ